MPRSERLYKREDEDANMLTGTREGSLSFYNEKMLSGDNASVVTTGLLVSLWSPVVSPPVSHTAANILECFHTHTAHVADRDVVLFNDPKCSRASLLAYFFSFTLSSTKNTLL